MYMDNSNVFNPAHSTEVNDVHRKSSVSNLITSAPKHKTLPLQEDLQIVPPPPPISFSVIESESNTQSDVDSDVLDSSRSELGSTYRLARSYDDVRDQKLTFAKNKKMNSNSSKYPSSSRNKAKNNANTEFNDDVNSDFEQHLAVLENELDAHLKAEVPSASTPSRSSNFSASSVDSVIKVSDKTSDKYDFDIQTDEDSSLGDKYSITDISEVADVNNDESSLDLTLTNDSALVHVKERAKQWEKQSSGRDVDPFEPKVNIYCSSHSLNS